MITSTIGRSQTFVLQSVARSAQRGINATDNQYWTRRHTHDLLRNRAKSEPASSCLAEGVDHDQIYSLIFSEAHDLTGSITMLNEYPALYARSFNSRVISYKRLCASSWSKS
jgi:hypothetical protein